MMRRAILLLALLSGTAASASAQADSCDLVESQEMQRDQFSGVLIMSGPFLVRCEGGAELRARSGTLNEFSRELVLDGDVFFQDPEQTLTADHATYTSTIGRLYATGNVVFTDRVEGSTIRGPELEYFRAMEGRPEATVNAGQRPHLTLRPKDQGEDAEPLELDADRVSILGQSDLSAFGNVVIERPNLNATAAEARYDADTDGLELRGGARILSERFSLGGEVIQAVLADGALEHVQARTRASLQGDELTVEAPELQMFFANELLQRAVARGAAEDSVRPVAVARSFRLEADSIDALTPGQKLDRVIAIGAARGEAIDTTGADSAAVPAEAGGLAVADSSAALADSVARPDPTALAALALVDRDWIRGDTLIGYFEAPNSAALAADTAAADTAVALKRIVAQGSAQSLYRVQPQDTAAAGAQRQRRGVNYLAGESIELTFAAGELDVAQVTGLRRGVYLDPAAGPPGVNQAVPGDTFPGVGRESMDAR